MLNLDEINGSELLTANFGKWPSFHDSEILWIHLNRNPQAKCYGPTVETLIRTFNITSKTDQNGYLILQNHALVHFRFHNVFELKIDGFNHQNVLFDLSISDIRDRQMEDLRFDIRFDSSFGVDATFQCREIEVVEVKPCDKYGEPSIQ